MKLKIGNMISYEGNKINFEGYIADICKNSVEVRFSPWAIKVTEGNYYGGTGREIILMNEPHGKISVIADSVSQEYRDSINNARVSYMQAKDDIAFIKSMLDKTPDSPLVEAKYKEAVIDHCTPYASSQDEIDSLIRTVYMQLAGGKLG